MFTLKVVSWCMSETNKNLGLILEEGKSVNPHFLLIPLAQISIYLMIIPTLMIDLTFTLYQSIYFSIMKIPKIKKSEYISIDRWDLNKLNLWQKINCLYCEYTNGILAFAKAVGNQTEIYSCAIKHQHALKGHEYEKKFYPEKSFH